jgi:hypothetical protein
VHQILIIRSFEIGTNPLFEDRVEELVILDGHQGLGPPTMEMPKWKKPDRIYGLRQTTNFETVLLTLRQPVRTNPFEDMIEPLLFPFLILEAKSERSPKPDSSPHKNASQITGRPASKRDGCRTRFRAPCLVFV